MIRKPLALGLVAVLALSGAAYSGGHGGNPAVKARKAHMQLYSFNLGTLGAMAKGEVEYDAETASTAANNLAAVSQLSQRGYWLPGTSSDDLPDESRALPALWQEGSKAGEIGGKFAEAAAALAAVAGDGKDAMAAAMGPVGKACGDCHEAYRKPRN
ncbi:MAG: cytochrome c [Paracoccaceae bacterium]|nr:cytochrome c [Paracoccaceae bacterium]